MQNVTELNKSVVLRFNKGAFHNHTAAPGVPANKEGMVFFLQNMLRKGFPDLRVEIYEQVAEGDLVTTRKKIHVTHTGEIAGLLPNFSEVLAQLRSK